MPLTFEEIELIKNVFENCYQNIKKESILRRLESIKENTKDKELDSILESTIEKIKIINDMEVEKIISRIFSDELII